MTSEHQIRIVQFLLEHFGEQLKAVVAFGSVATGQAKSESDLDLLVVAEGLPARWPERKPTLIHLTSRLRMGRHVDLVLVTPEECRENFESHHPLYLDIAFDGMIFFDRDFVATLMEETKAYVARRGILRKKTGWRFPVEYRKETPLSKVTNGNWAKVWLEDAIRDLAVAQVIKTQQVYEKAVYHCQQAVEKYIKAILVCWGEFEKSHYVSDVLVECLAERTIDPEWRAKLEAVAQIGKDIEPEVGLSRYPAKVGDDWWIPAEEYDEPTAEDWIKKAEHVVNVTREFVDWWFHPEKSDSASAE
jgi:HEPN domain-containing protein/predicted nucleotidyltransferase